MDPKSVAFSLRPATEGDRSFLYALHRTTMGALIEQVWGWDESWQQQDFDRRFREYQGWIIEREERAAGGLFVEWRREDFYLHEIQLMPGFQGLGIGTAVLRWVIEQAAAHGVPATLSVLAVNPRARQLYERLGFKVTAYDAPFFRMRHDASATDGLEVNADGHS